MGETDRVRAVPPPPEPRAWRVILQTLHPTQTRIGLNVWEELIIGRGGGEGVDAPGLDLSPHQAGELGISRQHAALIPGHDALYLVDLDSTNGTWINHRYLAPHQRYPLRTGDLIELSLLHLAVRLVEPLKR
jgi:pSer/pThr/pTyr-binding forkhead associated (FHA) protein